MNDQILNDMKNGSEQRSYVMGVESVASRYFSAWREVARLENMKFDLTYLKGLIQAGCVIYGSKDIGEESGVNWWVLKGKHSRDEAIAKLEKVYGCGFGQEHTNHHRLEWTYKATVKSTDTRTLVKQRWFMEC